MLHRDHPGDDDDAVLQEILKRQTRAIERLAKHFSPEEQEKEEKRWRSFMMRLAAITTISFSGILGSWELVSYLKAQYDIRQLAEQYAEAATEIYYEENNPDVAMDFIGKALKLQENVADYWYLQAYIEGMAVVRKLMNLDRPLLKDEVDKAHVAIAHAVLLQRLDAERPEPFILRGQIYAALGEKERADKALQEAIRIDPKNDFAHVRLAVLYSEEKRVDDALKELDTALAINAKSKWAYLWRGVILAEQRQQWEEARKAYDQALALDSRFDLAYYNLGWTYVNQKPADYGKARELFEKALTINPSYKEAFYGLGMVYGYQNLYEIAALYLDKAIELDKTFLTAWKWRGIIRVEQEQYGQALEDFTQAISLSPSEPELYVRRGRIYAKKKEVQNAVADLRFAAQLNPNDKKTWLYLGDVFMDAEQTDQAQTYYEKALALDAQYSEVYGQLAQVWLKRGNADKAREAFDNAVNNAAYRPERFLLPRGRFLEGLGQNDLALADYRAARTSDPNMAEAWFAEAQLLLKNKDKNPALEAITKYIEIKPTDPQGQELREKINAL